MNDRIRSIFKQKKFQYAALAAVVVLVIIGATVAIFTKKDAPKQTYKPVTTKQQNTSTEDNETIPTNASYLITKTKQATQPVGSIFTVELIEDSRKNNVNAVQAEVTYDPAIVRLDTITADSKAFPVKASEKIEDGTARLVYGTTANTQSGEQKVATLTFTALKPGKTKVEPAKSSIIISTEQHTNILQYLHGTSLTVQ